MRKSSIPLLALSILLGACQQNGKFHIEGSITDAKDTTLYLEHITLANGVVAIDSAKLDEKGAFHLKGEVPESPEFYRLRIGRQAISLAIDSARTIQVEADMSDMSFGYKVTGSGTCDTIRQMALRLAALEKQIHAVARDRRFTVEERNDSVASLIEAYKYNLKKDFIQHYYETPASYFACFQVLGGRLLFDPMTNASDLTWMNAVANAWEIYHPGCERTENLKNIVFEGRRNQKKPQSIVLDIDDSKVKELGIIDMTFPDVHGNEVSLSSLKGKVVLLDISAFSLKGSPERTMQMRELYNEYHGRGFEIYQVSVDPNRHYWAQCCEQLPWISVYCEEGMDNDIISLYQPSALPYYYLIDRECDLHARQENIKDLKKAIEALL